MNVFHNRKYFCQENKVFGGGGGCFLGKSNWVTQLWAVICDPQKALSIWTCEQRQQTEPGSVAQMPAWITNTEQWEKTNLPQTTTIFYKMMIY